MNVENLNVINIKCVKNISIKRNDIINARDVILINIINIIINIIMIYHDNDDIR